MLNKYLIFKLIVIIWTLNVFGKTSGNESCWNNDNECNIKTKLFRNFEFLNGISMQIDCRRVMEENDKDRPKEENDFRKSKEYLLIHRFTGVQSVMLDGCQTPLNTHTFGLEYLPICVNITKVSIRHFHMDILKPFKCKRNENYEEQALQLEYLNIQFNEITVINGNSFSKDYAYLRGVLIERNSLKLIHADAFRSLRSLEKLHIVNEPELMLKYADLFKYTSVEAIHLEALEQMTSDIFRNLPESLQNLYVANTKFDNDDVVTVNALVLKNLTIKHCGLRVFSLHDVHSTVKFIDLSGNVMKIFTAYENNLKELNLSDNKLEWVPFEWLSNLTNLEILDLKSNFIKSLSLEKLLHVMPNGHFIDISKNHLQYLQDYNISHQDVSLHQARLKSDQNPWDCLWLHEFARQYPETFRILQYEKFISKINVNGLECIPAEKSISPRKIHPKFTNISLATMSATEQTANVSTYTLIYGSPWEFKRNQRAEALIIVFMLPLGIALLFLLLYMWIYCQKMFHLSYYQDFPCMRRSTTANNNQRFDVVRQFPPCSIQTATRQPLNQIIDINNQGYEIPLNGVIADCNCIGQNSDHILKCQKSVHITYEQSPTEAPHEAYYEEIIHVEDNPCCNDSLDGVINRENDNETYDRSPFI